MDVIDLSYSNAFYLFKSITKCEKTVYDICEELSIKRLCALKLIDKLINIGIVCKRSKNDNTVGRPKTYYFVNPSFYSSVIYPVDKNFQIKNISTSGEEFSSFKISRTFQGFDETNILKFVRGYIGTVDPYSLGKFLIIDDPDSVGEINLVDKLTFYNFLISTFSDNDKVILLNLTECKILINHGNAKIIDKSISIEEINNILNIDEFQNFESLSKVEIIDKVTPLFGIKILEKRINHI